MHDLLPFAVRGSCNEKKIDGLSGFIIFIKH